MKQERELPTQTGILHCTHYKRSTTGYASIARCTALRVAGTDFNSFICVVITSGSFNPCPVTVQTIWLSSVIFSIACPIRGDVSSIAYGQEMKIGRFAQIINNFERGGLLSGDSIRINRIYNGEITLFTQLPNDP